ncbi:MAG: hypothetical protein ACPLPX_01110 [Candidatus Kapaibacteriota bacterium]
MMVFYEKDFFISAFFALALVLYNCNTSPSSNDVNSPNVSSIVLPPGFEPTTIVIVDKNGTVYDSGIKNKSLPDGSTINQKIQECIRNSRNHGDFVSCMAHLTNWLMKNGYITNKEKGILMNIAARADIP